MTSSCSSSHWLKMAAILSKCLHFRLVLVINLADSWKCVKNGQKLSIIGYYCHISAGKWNIHWSSRLCCFSTGRNISPESVSTSAEVHWRVGEIFIYMHQLEQNIFLFSDNPANTRKTSDFGQTSFDVNPTSAGRQIMTSYGRQILVGLWSYVGLNPT